MKKFLPVIAIAAFASSGAVLAQTTTTLSDGTVVQTNPAPVYVTPELSYRPAPILINPTLPPNQQVVGVAAAPVPGQAVAYLEPEVVLVGNVKGPIKGGGPKYDPLGRKIYAPRAIGR